MTYDIWPAEREIQASAERLAAAEGFDWYAPAANFMAEAELCKKRRIYRERAAAGVIPNLPDDHPWKLAAR